MTFHGGNVPIQALVLSLAEIDQQVGQGLIHVTQTALSAGALLGIPKAHRGHDFGRAAGGESVGYTASIVCCARS